MFNQTNPRMKPKLHGQEIEMGPSDSLEVLGEIRNGNLVFFCRAGESHWHLLPLRPGDFRNPRFPVCMALESLSTIQRNVSLEWKDASHETKNVVRFIGTPESLDSSRIHCPQPHGIRLVRGPSRRTDHFGMVKENKSKKRNQIKPQKNIIAHIGTACRVVMDFPPVLSLLGFNAGQTNQGENESEDSQRPEKEPQQNGKHRIYPTETSSKCFHGDGSRNLWFSRKNLFPFRQPFWGVGRSKSVLCQNFSDR